MDGQYKGCCRTLPAALPRLLTGAHAAGKDMPMNEGLLGTRNSLLSMFPLVDTSVCGAARTL